GSMSRFFCALPSRGCRAPARRQGAARLPKGVAQARYTPSLTLHQYQVIPMHQLRFVDIAENAGNRLTGLTNDPRRFMGSIVDQSPCDFATGQRSTDHHFATPEVTLHRLDTNRQQTGTPTLQGPDCTIIEQ